LIALAPKKAAARRVSDQPLNGRRPTVEVARLLVC
jgi:hypothetical protein